MNIVQRISKYKDTDNSYAGVLFTALQLVGAERLEEVLNEAEKQGKKVELIYSIPFESGPSEPHDVKVSS